MRAKIKKITRFAADWIAPAGFFTVMCFIWIAACAVALVNQIDEGWVWKQGILFTDYGRELVKELMEIVKFVEEEEEYV